MRRIAASNHSINLCPDVGKCLPVAQSHTCCSSTLHTCPPAESRTPPLTLDEIKGSPALAGAPAGADAHTTSDITTGTTSTTGTGTTKDSGLLDKPRQPVIFSPKEPAGGGSLGEGSVGVAAGDPAGGANIVAAAKTAGKGILVSQARLLVRAGGCCLDGWCGGVGWGVGVKRCRCMSRDGLRLGLVDVCQLRQGAVVNTEVAVLSSATASCRNRQPQQAAAVMQQG